MFSQSDNFCLTKNILIVNILPPSKFLTLSGIPFAIPILFLEPGLLRTTIILGFDWPDNGLEMPTEV